MQLQENVVTIKRKRNSNSNSNIVVKDVIIKTIMRDGIDYICITDIARQKNPIEPKDVVKNWMRQKNTLEYLGLWEKLNNPMFNGVEFDPLFSEAGNNSFTMSPSRWIELTGGNWYNYKKRCRWRNLRTERHCIQIRKLGVSRNAEEADVLNVAIFGMTAKEWRENNPELKGNIRDYATINELICISNMENINSVLINEGIPQGERLEKLNKIAIHQMNILENSNNRHLLK